MHEQRAIFTSEHHMFRENFQEFIRQEILPYQEEWERTGIVSRNLWLKAGEQGFLVPNADEKFGGQGIDDFCLEVIMNEELAYVNESGFALALHNSLVAPYLLSYCTDSQKEKIIPKITSGENILAIAMSEPAAGSDLAGMKTNAVRKGDQWILNGQKTFITNGILSNLILVAAKTDPHDPRKMGLFLVEGDMKGFTRGKPFKKMGLHSQDTAELFFENVTLSSENLLGHPHKGFLYMMDKLALERLTVAITSIALAEAALKETITYVRERKAFGKTISKFQNTKFKLAELKTEIDLGRTYIDHLIKAHIKGTLKPEDACKAKYWSTDLACKVTDECVQLHGGYGYMMEYPICKMYLNSRVGKIYAGSNEIMKTVIAKSLDL